MDEPEPYGLSPAFERAVAVLACSRPRFYGRIGYALDSEALSQPAAQLAIRAAHAIKAEVGHGPDSSIVLVQRLHTWMHDGKVALEQVHQVIDMFDDAEDAGLPSEETAINELRPVLQQRLRRRAVREAIASHGNKQDLGAVVELEKEAQMMGQTDTSIGVAISKASFEDIRQLRHAKRLRTGIMELDHALDGGHHKGHLAVVCGGTGAGKSVFLNHQAAVSVMEGHVVAALSLELPRAMWQARAMAAVTGIPINTILDDAMDEEKILAQFNEKASGILVVHQMPGQGTQCSEVFRWFDAVEQHLGRKVTVKIIDYADKLYVPPRKGKEVGSYDAGKFVMEDLREHSESTDSWLWTASQSRGREQKKKRLDTSDTAESINKPRIADLWITLNVSDDQSEVEFFIAKHRTAMSRMTVGPLPTQFEIGRIAPIMEI